MYSITELENEKAFSCIGSFDYSNDKESISFFKKYLIQLTPVSFIYFFFILGSVILITALTFTYGVYQSLSALGFAIFASIVYIVLHEIIHGLCFIAVGGKI